MINFSNEFEFLLYVLNNMKELSIYYPTEGSIIEQLICFSCTVVLFNPRKNTQAHVLNACRKTVTSLALAGDGRFLATGECGHMPNVRVWDISDPYNAVQFAEFSGHKYGINCVVSSNRKYISIRSNHNIFHIEFIIYRKYIFEIFDKYSQWSSFFNNLIRKYRSLEKQFSRFRKNYI